MIMDKHHMTRRQTYRLERERVFVLAKDDEGVDGREGWYLLRRGGGIIERVGSQQARNKTPVQYKQK